MQERLVRFRVSTVLAVLGIAIAVAVLLEVVWIARQVLAWIIIALFFALALNPAVDFFQRHDVRWFCYVGGKWTVKYRFTHPKSEDADREIQEFIQKWSWYGDGV